MNHPGFIGTSMPHTTHEDGLPARRRRVAGIEQSEPALTVSSDARLRQKGQETAAFTYNVTAQCNQTGVPP